MSWRASTLAEITEAIDYGYTASASNEPLGPKFLRITDIQNSCVDWNHVPYCDAPSEVGTRFYLKTGDIVFARTGATTGKSFLLNKCPDNVIFASYLIRVRPNTDVVPAYLAHYFHSTSYWNQINAAAKGSAQPGVNASLLKQILVPLPPLDEQKRIVAILDQAFASIAIAKANTEKNLANARELFSSYVALQLRPQEGWLSSDIQACFGLRSGDFMPARSMDSSGVVPVYGGNGIAGTHSDHNIDGTNIIIGRVGALCGNVRLVHGKIWLTDNAFVISEYKRQLDKHFLSLLLQFNELRSLAKQAAQPVISYSGIKNMILQFPPDIERQKQIAFFIQKFEKELAHSNSKNQRKLAALDELKQSLLHAAFTGQLTAAEPVTA